MILFAAAVFVMIGAHFAFAYRDWRRSKGKAAAEIDFRYVHREDYLGNSFRAKVGEWISNGPEGATEFVSPRRERVRVTGDQSIGDGARLEDVLVVRGNFTSGSKVVLGGEIYVTGDCRIGGMNTLRALAVDGNLSLDAGTSVQRWLDCLGSIDIAPGCRLDGRTIAKGAVRLAVGASTASICSTELIVGNPVAEIRNIPPERPKFLLCSEGVPPSPTELERAGIDGSCLRRVSADTWMYDGDLNPRVEVHLEVKVFVRGDCTLPAWSVARSLKTEGSLETGAHFRSEGPLVAGGDIAVGRDSILGGVIFAGGTVHLAAGTQVGEIGKPIAVFGKTAVELEEGVVIHGKAASGSFVTGILASVADQQVSAEDRKPPMAASASSGIAATGGRARA